MAIQVRTGYIAGCRGLVITQLTAAGAMPAVPVRYGIRTAQAVGEEREYVEGERITQRGGDRVLAQREAEDVLIAINLTFRNARIDARAVEIIAGGAVRLVSGNVVGYDAPLISAQGTRLPFLTEVFAENYLGQSVLQGFIRLTYPLCIGRLPTQSFTDNEWASPEFGIRVRENPVLALPVVRWEFVDTLPAELV